MSLVVEVQRQVTQADLPEDRDFNAWANEAAGDVDGAELVIRLVDNAESAELNGRFRNKPHATNVLSFPAEIPASVGELVMGDLVVCAPVVQAEAREQGKSEKAHWAHMIVHGVLHLRGYDHIDDAEAQKMEQLETDILARLGFSDPYQ